MNILTLLIIAIIASILAAVASLFLKKSTTNLKMNFAALRNKNFIIGVLLYGVSTLIYMIALKNGELNVVYPISSFSYVFVSLLSIKYLGEKMNAAKWAGIIFIIIGVFLIVR